MALTFRDDSSANPAPKRTSSLGTLLKRGTDTLLGRDSSPPSSKDSWEIDEKENRDPLPADRQELEGRLNYHLSELDRLKNYVVLMNDITREHHAKLVAVSQKAKERGDGMIHSSSLFLTHD